MAENKKISVKICMGTTCFVMGGGSLSELTEIIPRKYGDKIEIIGSPCLELCSKNEEYSKAPYVKVDDEVISQATVEKIFKVIDKKIGNI